MLILAQVELAIVFVRLDNVWHSCAYHCFSLLVLLGNPLPSNFSRRVYPDETVIHLFEILLQAIVQFVFWIEKVGCWTWNFKVNILHELLAKFDLHLIKFRMQEVFTNSRPNPSFHVGIVVVVSLLVILH